MALRTCMLFAALVAPACASAYGMVGPEWRAITITPSEGQVLDLRLEGNATVSVHITMEECDVRDKVSVDGYADLSHIGFFHDVDDNGRRRYLLEIPYIEVKGQQQTHYKKSFDIGECRILPGEVDLDEPEE